MKTDLRDLSIEELEHVLKNLGEPKFRAKQLFKWAQSHIESFDEMTNIGKNLREKLATNFYIVPLIVEEKQVSEIDGTIKYLFKLHDGNYIESVLMSYKHGNTICVSSQVGCRMGCNFCASTIGGLSRNLTPGEIISQVLFAQKDSDSKISNIVMMGIGEPLDNYDNVIKFLKLINHDDGLNIGHRHISLSTCGIVDKIYALAEENLQITLSISLHSANDETRTSMMPINKKYNIDQLITACRDYLSKTNRRISFEYSMINGVNDSSEEAGQLAALLKGMLAHVNLIPINKIEERDYQRSNDKSIRNFSAILEKQGINVTVRRKLGSDIDASCGQLRKKRV